MNETSQTLIPGATLYKPHVENAVETMSFAEEARRAAESANKQSTKRITHVKET